MKQFGETVEGYNIPVLNEREIRAAAGILFFFVFIAITRVIYTGDFSLIKYFVLIFLSDFIIRIFINPKYSPSLILGRLIVSRQTPEYVGAAQKKFAWIIGLVLGIIMFGLLILLNSYSFITGIICLICQIFLFFESVFGICLGCIFYGWFYKEKAQYCPGEVCDVKAKQDIQKTNKTQLLTLLIFSVLAIGTFILLKSNLSQKPIDLFVLLHSYSAK